MCRAPSAVLFEIDLGSRRNDAPSSCSCVRGRPMIGAVTSDVRSNPRARRGGLSAELLAERLPRSDLGTDRLVARVDVLAGARSTSSFHSSRAYAGERAPWQHGEPVRARNAGSTYELGTCAKRGCRGYASHEPVGSCGASRLRCRLRDVHTTRSCCCRNR